MKRLKKGFTIVELVIVIAVIAVLTAVLVPTFISLSKKGKDTLDKNIVTNANIQLAASESLEGKNRSMSEAVEDVDQIGYHMSTVQTNNGNMIVWDQVNDRFVLLDKGGNVILKDERTNVPSDQNKLFYPIEKLSDRGDFKFAIFAKVNYEGPTSFTSATSFDAGEKKGIESISYAFTSNSEVLVVTNSEDTTLNVDAPNADFKHVGLCGKIDIEEVADDSFNDHGHVGYVEIESGHYVADEGSKIKAVYATSDSAKVDKQNGGQIENAYGGAASYTGDNSKGNVELDFNDNKAAVEEQALEDLDHEINPLPAHVLSEADKVAQSQHKTMRIGNEYFASISEAAEAGYFDPTDDGYVPLFDKLYLIGNVTDSTHTLGLIGNPWTLDLNGYQFILQEGMAIVDATFTVKNSGTDEGSVFSSSSVGWFGPCGMFFAMGGTINIEGGVFDATLLNDNMFDTSYGACTFNISGGYFKAAAGKSIFAQKNSTFNLTGGTFDATASGSSIFGFTESAKSVDVSKIDIVSGSAVYKA